MSDAIDAVIFDFDGLIVDTETNGYEALASVFADFGAELTLADFVKSVGTRHGVDWGALLHAKTRTRVSRSQRNFTTVSSSSLGPTSRQLRDLAEPRERVGLDTLTINAGVRDWLRSAADAKLPCAIASSSERHWIEPHLHRLGIAHHFAALATWEGDDCGYPPKPAPDLYLHACAALGVVPRDAIALEDSPNGVAAAKAAGLFCIAVPGRITARLDFSAADVIVESLAAFSLADAVAVTAARHTT